jgi:hypothetical protein
MNIHYSTGLEHEFPDQAVRYSFIDIANVDGGFLVLLPVYIVSLDSKYGKIGNRAYQCLAPDILVVDRGIWRGMKLGGEAR